MTTFHDLDLGFPDQSAVTESQGQELTAEDRLDLGVLADDLEQTIPILDKYRIVGLRLKGWVVKLVRRSTGRTATQEAPAVPPSPPVSRNSLDPGGGFHEVGGSTIAKGEHALARASDRQAAGLTNRDSRSKPRD